MDARLDLPVNVRASHYFVTFPSPTPAPPQALSFTHVLGWTQGAEVRNVALSLGERVASVASQVRGYLVILAHLIPLRRASDPSPGPRPDEVHRDRGPPSPFGRGQRPNSVPFSSGKGQKTEVGPLCPARDVGHAHPQAGGSCRSHNFATSPSPGVGDLPFPLLCCLPFHGAQRLDVSNKLQ